MQIMFASYVNFKWPFVPVYVLQVKQDTLPDQPACFSCVVSAASQHCQLATYSSI
jgi:hypothetical protein